MKTSQDLSVYTLLRQLKSKHNSSCFDDHSDILKPSGSLNGKSFCAYSEVGLTFSQCYNHPTYLHPYKTEWSLHTESVSSLTRTSISQTIRKYERFLLNSWGLIHKLPALLTCTLKNSNLNYTRLLYSQSQYSLLSSSFSCFTCSISRKGFLLFLQLQQIFNRTPIQQP